MANPLDDIAFDWGARCFSDKHMHNLPLRALRMIEEAVEAGQALDIDRVTLHKLVDTVYSRPPGELMQELGGTILTTRMLCMAAGVDPEAAYQTEVRRCLGKSPEHFARRNQEKLDLGLDHKNNGAPEGI